MSDPTPEQRALAEAIAAEAQQRTRPSHAFEYSFPAETVAIEAALLALQGWTPKPSLGQRIEQQADETIRRLYLGQSTTGRTRDEICLAIRAGYDMARSEQKDAE